MRVSQTKTSAPKAGAKGKSAQYVITPAMRDKLVSLGHSKEAIKIMTPMEARDAINKSKGK